MMVTSVQISQLFLPHVHQRNLGPVVEKAICSIVFLVGLNDGPHCSVSFIKMSCYSSHRHLMDHVLINDIQALLV